MCRIVWCVVRCLVFLFEIFCFYLFKKVKMHTNFFVLICLCFFMNYSLGKILYDQNFDESSENKLEDILVKFENKMNTLFSIWNTKTYRKLDTLEQIISDLEENINLKIYTLSISILDNLEEHIDRKLNNVERSITKKFNQHLKCNSDVVDKKTFETFENNINIKFDAMARNISKKLEGNFSCNLDDFKKVIALEEILKEKLEALDKKIPVKFNENISTKFDAFVTNISKKFEEKHKCISADKSGQTTLDRTLNASATTESKPNKTGLPCKEESLSRHRRTPIYSMDDEALNHVTVRRDSAGLLEYFEMHVALAADESLDIPLWDKVNDPAIQYYIHIGWNGNQHTDLDYHVTTVQHTHTPDLLSSTQFRRFYIKIDDGKLEFGAEGDSSPLISQHDARFRLLKYFLFGFAGHDTARVRYDCPVPQRA